MSNQKEKVNIKAREQHERTPQLEHEKYHAEGYLNCPICGICVDSIRQKGFEFDY